MVAVAVAVARTTPTPASGAAFTGRPGQSRPAARSGGSFDRTAATRTGRSAAKPSGRSARARPASSQSELTTDPTRAGSVMVVRAGPYRSTTAATAMAGRSSSTSSSGLGGPGRSSRTVPISSSSRVMGAAVDAEADGAGADVSAPSGEARTTRPVPCSRTPATHSAGPAEDLAGAARSTRRRIGVS
ncbi:hypothetical protein [Streptomyces erythrochromogenes]|uniref:hypothetical protein n=1 Tax=Streptomyces erythrochromogenes TaxID=285574 RepID=UPI00382F441E